MLVYANHLKFTGADAEESIFKAIGGWLKEQLGFGLHPEQLRQDGEYSGYRGNARSWLRIRTTNEEEPQLYAWELKNQDEDTHGRLWVTELGLKVQQGTVYLSCTLKTEEQSILIDQQIEASRPRLISYVARNIKDAIDADFCPSIPGTQIKKVGDTIDSYRGLLADIERRARNYPILLISPTIDGEYLVNTDRLQQILVGLAQVVQIDPEYNSYEMAGILGQDWSAWNGAINLLQIPMPTGRIRKHLFLSETIEGWGNTQDARISKLLAWVTNSTNIPRMRERIRPEGIAQLALRRKLQTSRARSSQMDEARLRQELEHVWHLADDQSGQIGQLEDEIRVLENDIEERELARLQVEETLDEVSDTVRKKDFEVQSLKNQLVQAGVGRASTVDADILLNLACRPSPPTVIECLEVIESIYGDKCIILESAKNSARNMDNFVNGKRLLDMLKRLATEYRSKLNEGGDSEARKVFGKNEYAAKESETVMDNKVMRRARTFEYRGNEVEMFSHLKIGIDDDTAKTIRVHFHWDAEQRQIVIGYCGKHLPVASY